MKVFDNMSETLGILFMKFTDKRKSVQMVVEKYYDINILMTETY